ncbi:MAG TPA: DNA ligase D [Candidatus Obscuribacterales bacterium]
MAKGRATRGKTREQRLELGTVGGAHRRPPPKTVSPMLASLPRGTIRHAGWVFEPKLDGIRCIAVIRDGTVSLLSRRALNLTSQYPSIASELSRLVKCDAVLDGEIIAVDAQGRPSFQQLQQRMNLTKQADIARADKLVPVQYYVFDVAYFDGFDLTNVRLLERKKVLEQAIIPSETVRLLSFFDVDPALAYEVCVDNGFEGIVAKRVDSMYECGKRSPSWLKVKAQQTAEFIIGGYTLGQGSRNSTFGSLLLGYNDTAGRMVYCGSVGTGFDQRLLKETLNKIEPLKTKACPFVSRPEDKKDVIWVKPEVIVEVKYMDLTKDGHLRTPVFMRFREDKEPAEVLHPDSQKALISGTTYAAAPETVSRVAESSSRDATPIPTRNTSGLDRPQDRLEGDGASVYEKVIGQLSGNEKKLELFVENEQIPLSHLDKEFWPETEEFPALTKRDYLRHLCKIAPYLLPHWYGRPLTVIRYPDGIKGKSFFQKNWNAALPDFVETQIIESGEARSEYLLCNNLATLMFLAQHSVLEFHVCSSRLAEYPDPPAGTIDDVEGMLDLPDFLIVDLDYHPQSGKKVPDVIDMDAFKRVCDVASILRESLAAAGLQSYLKTSGRNGLHIFVPVKRDREVDFLTTRTLAQTTAQLITGHHPDKATIEFDISRRAGKVYVDCSSNGTGKTMAAVYTPRAFPGAPVSAPLSWNELSNIRPSDLTLSVMPQRLAQRGDLWKDILVNKHDLHALLTRRNT